MQITQLVEDGCANQAAKQCIACAKTHGVDLRTANCTTEEVIQLCEHKGQATPHAGCVFY